MRFRIFTAAANVMIMNGGGRRIAYKTYLLSLRALRPPLYEFYIACAARNFQNTDQLRAELAERFIASQTQQILKNRRQAILDGTAPSWENHISHYPENVPTSFARIFVDAERFERACVNETSFG
jgi:hypothetical protein